MTVKVGVDTVFVKVGVGVLVKVAEGKTVTVKVGVTVRVGERVKVGVLVGVTFPIIKAT